MSKHIAWQFWHDEKGITLEESNISTLRKMMESFIAGYEAAEQQRALDGAYCSCENPDIYINRVCQLCGKPHAPRQ